MPEELKREILDKNPIRFGHKVREVNRKYEENNNENVDNGVYNQFETDSDQSYKSQNAEVDQAVLNY